MADTLHGFVGLVMWFGSLTRSFRFFDPLPIVRCRLRLPRRRELFLEGQHLYDVRRLGLPLFPAEGTPYSTVYSKGGNYGTDICMPLPDVERFNNPNIED